MTHEKSTKIMSLNSFVGSWWAFNSISVGEAFMDFFFGNDVITHIANRVNSLLCPSREHCSNTQKTEKCSRFKNKKELYGSLFHCVTRRIRERCEKMILWTWGKHFSPRAEVMTQFPNDPRVHFSQTLILKFKFVCSTGIVSNASLESNRNCHSWRYFLNKTLASQD